LASDGIDGSKPLIKNSDPEVRVAYPSQNIVGEIPMWHPVEQCLYWVDTRKPCLQRLNDDGSITVWEMPVHIGSYVFHKNGGVVAALATGFAMVDLETGVVTPMLNPEPDKPDNRLNDGRCDRRGRFWAGTRNVGVTDATGSLYRLDPDLKCTRMDSGFIVSNGMAFSPDDRTLIFGDSTGETIYRYDLDIATGMISNRRRFLHTDRLPWRVDGATFDDEGYYWCALFGDWSIGRFDLEGRLDRIVRLPVSHPTMCNFGGENLDVLYVTSATAFLSEEERARQPHAGALFAVSGLGARGVAEPMFG
jgi:sugar lactone lactonase YvrE